MPSRSIPPAFVAVDFDLMNGGDGVVRWRTWGRGFGGLVCTRNDGVDGEGDAR